MPNRLQEAAENALPKLPSSLATMALPRILPAPQGSYPKMRAGVEDGNALSPIYIGDQKDFANPDYAPQLLGHELYHQKINNLPPKLRLMLPAENPSNPYNEGGRLANLKRVNGDPLKLPNEEGAADMQEMIAARQRGEKLDPIYDTFDRKFGELPLSVMQPTDPNQKGINTMPRDPGLPAGYSMGTGKILQAQNIKPVPKGSGDSAPDFIPDTSASTPDFIPDTSQASAAPTDTVSATPPSQHPVQDWLHNLDTDITEGGNRTLPGRFLGRLEGRGDAGYAGLRQGGQSNGVIDFMGSPIRGPIHAAQGIAETPQHPLMGPVHALEGGLETLTIPSSVITPEASEINPIMKGISKVSEMVPTRAKAGRLFEDVMGAAADRPVTLTRSGDQLLRVRELADNGTSMPQAAGKLLRRVTDPEAGPLTYRTARDFASNISRASANETMRLSPNMQREMGILSPLLNADVGDTAMAAGKGPEYIKAMKMYSQASRNAATAKSIGKFALKYAPPLVVGGYGAAKILKDH